MWVWKNIICYQIKYLINEQIFFYLSNNRIYCDINLHFKRKPWDKYYCYFNVRLFIMINKVQYSILSEAMNVYQCIDYHDSWCMFFLNLFCTCQSVQYKNVLIFKSNNFTDLWKWIYSWYFWKSKIL